MKNWIILFSLFCIACGNNTTKEYTEFQLELGDLLFQDLDSSPLCDAIELVTPGYKDGNFSHIGIVVEIVDPYCMNPEYEPTVHIRILEALPGGVITTRLDSFLMRSSDYNNNPKVIVGRLKEKYLHSVEEAVSYSKSKLNIEYDEVFLMNNNSYYCSELIYEAFLNDSIFELKPMTFLHPKTKDTLKVWKEYYSDLNTNIPEGNPGINPGIMSLSNKIEMVHFYGIPDGLNN